MYVNRDRKYLSARILRYAANKIWILTTMASFISKSPGDNHVSCFPNILPVQSSVEGWKWVAPGTSGYLLQHPWGRADLWWILCE